MECPRCTTCELKEPIGLNAISSRDQKSWICSDCGRDESQIDFLVAKGKLDRIKFQSVAKEKYFCKKLGVDCRVV